MEIEVVAVVVGILHERERERERSASTKTERSLGEATAEAKVAAENAAAEEGDAPSLVDGALSLSLHQQHHTGFLFLSILLFLLRLSMSNSCYQAVRNNMPAKYNPMSEDYASTAWNLKLVQALLWLYLV
jgi:hypothetical protein